MQALLSVSPFLCLLHAHLLLFAVFMQIALYKENIKIAKSIAGDATGTVVKAIMKPNWETKYALLYQVAMQVKGGKISPIFQMLSAKHDTHSIEYWLNSFKRLTNSVPEEINCDFSLAFLNAASLSFNECKLSVYLSLCFLWLQTRACQHYYAHTFFILRMCARSRLCTEKKILNAAREPLHHCKFNI